MGNEILQEVAELLYGGGVDELIAKMEPTQSDISTKKKKREQTEARIAFGTNVVGLAAGAAGLHESVGAYKGAKYKKLHGKEAPEKVPKTKFGGKFKTFKGKYAVPIAAGAVGLQTANLAGDAIANRVLARSAKKDPNVKGGAPTAIREAKKQGKATTQKTKESFGKGLLVPVEKKLKTRSRAESVAGYGAVGLGASALPVTLSRHAGTKKGAALMGGAGLVGAGYGALKPVSHPRKGTQGRRPPANPTSEQKARRERLVAQQTKVKKSDEIDVVWDGEIAKADVDKQQIFGWASVVEVNGEPVVDLQGDRISTEEMEKAGYEYVMKSRKGGDMHLRDQWEPVQKSEMIESFIVTPEKKEAMSLPESVPTGWWVGFQVRDPDVWAKVKSGERTGFSIHGHGRRTPG